MQLSVTFRHMEPSDALKQYASDKLSRIEKYMDSIVEANVVLSVEKFRHTADVTIISDRLKINGQEETEDMYSAIDMVVDKLERQVKRNREKVKSRKPAKRGRSGEVQAQSAEIEEVEETEEAPKLVRTQQTFTKPMDLDEAIEHMELMTEPFLVFTNSATEKINVLFLRDDGNYGLIEPQD